jgi:glycosyltransferase involved in cell wall biosynthesis
MFAKRQKGWWLCSESFRLADLNIFVSRSLENILKQHVQPQGRCAVLLRGVNQMRFFPSRQKTNGRIVLFVGRLEAAKGIFDLLAAWKDVAAKCLDAKLWIVGPDSTDGEFTRQVHSRGHADTIKMLGPLPSDNVANLMRKAQILCLPSHAEGTPNCVMEALACGLPVVATRVGGIPDIVEDNKSGILVDNGDVKGLAEALLRLLHDSESRLRMGQAAYCFARRYLDSRKSATRLVKLYKELIKASAVGVTQSKDKLLM